MKHIAVSLKSALIAAFMVGSSALADPAVDAGSFNSDSFKNEFDAGLQAYEKARFDVAALHLKRATTLEPRHAKARFYLANALQHLNQGLSAWNEYRAAIAISPDGNTARYARIAMESAPPPLSFSQAEGEPSDDANATALENANRAAISRSTLASTSANLKVQNTIALMSEQAERIARSLEAQGERNAQQALTNGEWREKSLRSEQELQFKQLHDARFDNSFNKSFVNPLDLSFNALEQSKRIKKYYETLIQQARENAASEAEFSKHSARESARQFKADVEKLATQMIVQSHAPGAVQLDPTRTTLYVREYSSPKPQPQTPPVAELLADQDVLLLDSHTNPGKRTTKIVPKGASSARRSLTAAKPPAASARSDNADLKVQGQLLHL